MDRIEESNGFADLVGLKAPDFVQPYMRIPLFEARPFSQRFLYAIFAEVGLPGFDQRFDFIRATALADSNQLDFRRIAFREPGRTRNIVQDLLPAGGRAGQR